MQVDTEDGIKDRSDSRVSGLVDAFVRLMPLRNYILQFIRQKKLGNEKFKTLCLDEWTAAQKKKKSRKPSSIEYVRIT